MHGYMDARMLRNTRMDHCTKHGEWSMESRKHECTIFGCTYALTHRRIVAWMIESIYVCMKDASMFGCVDECMLDSKGEGWLCRHVSMLASMHGRIYSIIVSIRLCIVSWFHGCGCGYFEAWMRGSLDARIHVANQRTLHTSIRMQVMTIFYVDIISLWAWKNATCTLQHNERVMWAHLAHGRLHKLSFE